MTINYYFGNEDTEFPFEVDESQITDFLVDTWHDESKTPKTKESKQVIEHIIKQHSLWDDNEILDSYEDEMREYFEEDAEERWEENNCRSEDEKDWYGTKTDVIGL